MSSTRRPQSALLLSVLDRLLDDDPESRVEAPQRQANTLRMLRDAVRRDLENLLNTRCRVNLLPEHFPELKDSLANYGLPDFTGASLKIANEPDRLGAVIEEVISTFEPRLKNVRVEMLNPEDRVERNLRFKIRATLFVDPIEDRVLFNSSLEPSTGNFEVQGATL